MIVHTEIGHRRSSYDFLYKFRYIYIYIHLHIHIHMQMHMYIQIHICIHMCIYSIYDPGASQPGGLDVTHSTHVDRLSS